MKDGTKYGKYIHISSESSYEESLGPGILGITSKMCKGCYSYYVHWVLPDGKPKESVVGHPPHVHRENEMIFFIGMDPEHPEDLGATFEFSFGEEMERHVIDKTCCLTIPAGLPHGRYVIHETRRPWMFIRAHEAVDRTEKPRTDLLTEKEKGAFENLDYWKSQWNALDYDDDAKTKVR